MAGSALALVLPGRSAFDLEFVGADGHLRRDDLLLAWPTPFEAAEQARSFPLYRGMRNFPGWRWSASSGRHVGFESRRKPRRYRLPVPLPDKI